MDLSFTEEELAFRAEIRDFIKKSLPESIRTKMVDGHFTSKEDMVTWQRILNAKGWAVPHWPVDCGGAGWTAVQRYILREEIEAAPAMTPLSFNVNMVGPVIAQFGTPEQKKRFLPATANLDIWWCQGFSEPGAGSDLAGLRTAARREGDHYVVNGQKMWTTYAHYADWIFCLVRTDPQAKKQEGISFLLIDMKSPGITVKPIVTIDGAHEVNEVFFDEVKVPVENLVGTENRGWDCAKFLLGNERTGMARIGISKERLRHLKKLAEGELDNPEFRVKLAEAEIELKAHEMTTLRILSAEQRGTKGPGSSILKLRGTEISQKITELYMDLAGPFGLQSLREGPEEQLSNEAALDPEWAGVIAPTYFNYRKLSIYGGSNEIQKNILSKAVLGL